MSCPQTLLRQSLSLTCCWRQRKAGSRDWRIPPLLCPPLTNATMGDHMTWTPLSRICKFRVSQLLSCIFSAESLSVILVFHLSSSVHLTPTHVFATAPTVLHRNPLGLPISKRDSLLEKCAMFREAGGALSRQPSQDNGLDGPFTSGASKLEQVTPLSTKHHKEYFKQICRWGTQRQIWQSSNNQVCTW